MKVITHPVTGQKIGFGRKHPKVNPPMLHFGHYLLASADAPPAAVDYTKPALSGLVNILGNDVLGDCTSAAAFHIEDVFRANAGNGQPMTYRAQAIKFYSLTTGYVPGDPATDQGGDEITVLNYWRKHGLFGNGTARLTAYLAVDATNVNELKSAIWLAENLYFGLDLPDAWISPFPSGNGFVWDVAGDPDPNNGHAFCGLGYTADGVIIDTWGYLGVITWAAIAKYCTSAEDGQVFTVMGADQINWKTKMIPVNGLLYTQMLANIDAIV